MKYKSWFKIVVSFVIQAIKCSPQNFALKNTFKSWKPTTFSNLVKIAHIAVVVCSLQVIKREKKEPLKTKSYKALEDFNLMNVNEYWSAQ